MNNMRNLRIKMYYYNDSKCNDVVLSLIDDKSKIVWSIGSTGNNQFEGFRNKITIGMHPELLVLGNKERLYFTIPNLQPRTFISLANNLNPSLGYYEKPTEESCGRGISYLSNIRNWKKSGYMLQEEIDCLTEIPGHKSDVRIWIALCSDKNFWISPSCIIRVCRSQLSLDTKTRITNISAADKTLTQLDYENNDKYYQLCLPVCQLFINKLQNRINHKRLDNLWTILGLDIIIDKNNNNAYIIEVNTMPQFEHKTNEIFFNTYTRWINSLLLHINDQHEILK